MKLVPLDAFGLTRDHRCAAPCHALQRRQRVSWWLIFLSPRAGDGRSPTRLRPMQVSLMNVAYKKLAKTEPGQFQWQMGGWFGGLVGGSAWLIPTAAILAFNGQSTLAWVPLGCCLIVSFVGCALWCLRDRVRPFPALMVILTLFSITTPLAWFAVAANAMPESLASLNWPRTRMIDAMVTLICPAIIVAFCLREYTRGGVSNRPSQDGEEASVATKVAS